MAGNTIRERGQLSHITVVDRLGGRRINDRVGSRRNLCGAAPTLYDQLYRDAKRYTAAELDDWVTCPACRAALK